MVMLGSRFLKFHQSLQKCVKPSVRFLSQLSSSNHRTSYCHNLNAIAQHAGTDLEKLSSSILKNSMKYCKVPDEEKRTLLQDLLELRWNSLEIEVIEDQIDDLDEFIEDLCI